MPEHNLHIALIKPSLGEQRGRPYRTPAVLEPMFAALIAGQTSDDVRLHFFDERLENLDFEADYDLVVISVETFTALRSYQIAAEFRSRGNRVLLGGFHATLLPEEAAAHADSVAIGTVEEIWPAVLADLKSGNLQAQYCSPLRGFKNFAVDRSIFKDKKYLPVALIETSRGCNFNCNFCSVHSFYGNSVCFRPIDEVIGEIRALAPKFVFFTDDNIVAAPQQARKLFRQLGKLKIRWASQASITSAADPSFLDEMAASGCVAVIIGLESIRPEALRQMGKSWAPTARQLENALTEFRKRGIMVYGTFVFGYPGDTPGLIEETVDFAISQQLFMANFNMLYPFPGTPIYESLKQQDRLIDQTWWLSRSSSWDFPAFIPESMTPEQLSTAIMNARKKFGSISSIFRRSLNFDANLNNPLNTLLYFATNILSRRDINKKSGLTPGFSVKPEKMVLKE